MRTAPTPQPSSRRTDRRTSPAGPVRSASLPGLDEVDWGRIQDSSGSAAAVPGLLDRVATGDAETARAALAELRARICQYGFVVEQATAATVPFLWELAQRPEVACRAQIIRLLKNIADARQWESTAAVYPKLLNHRENHVVWERAARKAVRARRAAIERLMAEDDTEITRVTSELARTLAD
ncbi:hypothetical protein AB0E75_05210 [Streptomyces griseoviridis]|jgi:hypothetical protein|uniref:AbaA n=3 Tax=Streptomyces TaxID=1883 RepID=A0ABT9LQY6_STRGD|nr:MULTISPECIES: hypothetical protein [Streptomyces]MDP9685952.1 hypothetical protein [Streptomyces griseoviridis]GGS64892.1 hypothetical protein GCM10010238_62400 [Streptomyces niveoruber]GGS78342.1 hypothetical protein GCM10010240_09400 [Streptomyces griseoviridis]GGU15765.1 hypothetical protein GCM10010259_02580 [Streptomyces daghestanicus]GHI35239.1 hypothetical protein Sdagh_69690 [Streptomyces daghestanicus]